jgi:uncharacterized membrane protein YuzA (DUF378 family)
VFGSIGAVVMGGGMSMVMTDIAKTLGAEMSMTVGIVVGVVGLAMVIANFPIYKAILAKRRKRYADRIIAVSDQLINE